MKKSNWVVLGILALVVIGTAVSYVWNPQVTEAVLSSTLRQSTPLVLGALCGLLCERTGVVNIGIEGQMLFGAFTGILVNSVVGRLTGNLFLSLSAGIVATLAVGALTGLLLAYMSVSLKMDQIIAGTIINIFALGMTGYFYQQNLSTLGKLPPITLGPLAEIPLLGPVLFKNPPITFATLILVGVIHYALFYTRWGLRTRAVGEKPRAADTLGINVYRMRYLNVILGGMLAGLAGGFLTLEAVGIFERGMTSGRGFIALAVLIFGKWTPLGAWGGALLFGLAIALQTQLQFNDAINIPHQLIGMLPQVLTILVLAGFIGRAKPPAASGIPYEK